jgi:hypothetical protein
VPNGEPAVETKKLEAVFEIVETPESPPKQGKVESTLAFRQRVDHWLQVFRDSLYPLPTDAELYLLAENRARRERYKRVTSESALSDIDTCISLIDGVWVS